MIVEEGKEFYTLVDVQVVCGTMGLPTAVKIIDQGTERVSACVGTGPVDAAYKAIDAVVGKSVELTNTTSKLSLKARCWLPSCDQTTVNLPRNHNKQPNRNQRHENVHGDWGGHRYRRLFSSGILSALNRCCIRAKSSAASSSSR